jgi:1-deoxy-D-xylulose-5-phosphate synthase
VHKLLTGRQAGFAKLKQRGGVSGYPSQAESEHDIVENSHASTSLSYADGLAKAYRLRGESDRTVVALIGDGALTGGMAWEALNNIAAAKDSRLVIVVNDNGRSYTPTIGGLAEHLARVRVSQRYENVLDYIKTTLSRTPLVGPPVYETLHGIKKGIKDVLQPQVLFEDLGLKYFGPIDGHDEQLVEHALRRAADFGGGERRGRLPAPDRRLRAGHRAADVTGPARLDGCVQRGTGGDRRGAARCRGDHRGHALPDRAGPVPPGLPGADVRRRHR